MIKDFSYYDEIIVNSSGGKDSSACLLFLKENNVPIEKVSMWHQAIDGMGSTKKNFFDWPSTKGYVQSFADEFGYALDYQWRAYGFFGEMFRENSRTNDVYYTYDDSVCRLATKGGKNSTRLKWPAKTASLSQRWCSAYLKIDVAARALANHPRLQNKRILFITGERREESNTRAKYKEAELHRCNSKKRLVHHWRPIIDWKEGEIWSIMERNHIDPHPAYKLGFPRLSCRSCIFYSKDHWATLNEVDPGTVKMLQTIEEDLNFTIDNKLTLKELVAIGKSKVTEETIQFISKATSQFKQSVITNNWTLPSGAFGSGGGSI
ncbi:hypothetical protein DMA11_10215 [Marinilabiliaceae bacterium JC017]|nr:hypothetical protein DMA11_10215 [Marinilabiliaceae bacterium JC017]